MRTLICFFCGLLFYLSAFALQTKSQIRVTLPEGWTKVAGSVLEHQYLKNGASFMIKEETALNGKGLSEAVLIARKQLGQFFKGAEFSNDEKLKIDGYDAQPITFVYTAKVGGMAIKMKMQSIYVIVNGKCQNISFGSMNDQFDNMASDIQQILKGIKFK